jgi:hypothetical protein
MAELHVVAAVRAVDVVVFDEAPAEGASVAMRCFPQKETGSQRDHQQSDDCLMHDRGSDPA